MAAVYGFAISNFPGANQTALCYETQPYANWWTASIRPVKYGEIGFTFQNFKLGFKLTSMAELSAPVSADA